MIISTKYVKNALKMNLSIASLVAVELLVKKFDQGTLATIHISTAKLKCEYYCVPILKDKGACEIT